MVGLDAVLSAFLSNMTKVPNPPVTASRLDHHQVLSLRAELKPSSLRQLVTDKVHWLPDNQGAT